MENLDKEIKNKKIVVNTIGYTFIAVSLMFMVVGFQSAKKPLDLSFELNITQILFGAVCVFLFLIILFLDKKIKKATPSSGEVNKEIFNRRFQKWYTIKVVQLVLAESISMYGFVLLKNFDSSFIVSSLFFIASLILLIKYKPDINQFLNLLKSDEFNTGYKTS